MNLMARLEELKEERKLEKSIDPRYLDEDVKAMVISEANTEALRALRDRACALCVRQNINMDDGSHPVVSFMNEIDNQIMPYAGTADDDKNNEMTAYIKKQAERFEGLLAKYD